MPAGILTLSVHLLTMVLARLHSTQTLGSAILAHPSLYAAFVEDKKAIAWGILTGQIPPELMPFALAVYEAGFEGNNSTGNQIMALFDTHFGPGYVDKPFRCIARREAPTFLAACIMSKTHTVIEGFSRGFVQATLPPARERCLQGRPKGKTGASASEMYRIQRAFYRYQLFCNLFVLKGWETESWHEFKHPCKDMRHLTGDQTLTPTMSLVQNLFCDRSSPWVNEQLACVYDYMERRLSLIFDEVAAHDVEWGYRCVDWVSRGYRNGYKQNFLLRGVHFLHKLDQAKDYVAQCQLLKQAGPTSTPQSVKHALPFLFWQLPSRLKRSAYLARRPNVGYDSYFGNDYDDHEAGPFRTWYEAHSRCSPNEPAFLYHSWLRECGYVMWDAVVTVSKWELKMQLAHAWRKCPGEFDGSQDESRAAAMERSWTKRVGMDLLDPWTWLLERG